MAKTIKIPLVIISDINIFDNISAGNTINHINTDWKTTNWLLGINYTSFISINQQTLFSLYF